MTGVLITHTHVHARTPQVKTLADHLSRGGKATLKTKYMIYVCAFLSCHLSSFFSHGNDNCI